MGSRDETGRGEFTKVAAVTPPIEPQEAKRVVEPAPSAEMEKVADTSQPAEKGEPKESADAQPVVTSTVVADTRELGNANSHLGAGR